MEQVSVLAPGTTSWRVLRSAPLVWRETRPVVQLMFVLRYVVGGTVSLAAIGGPANTPAFVAHAILGGIASLAVSLYVYLLNGLTDIAGDRANGSRRPLATGALSARIARGWLLALVTIAVLVGFSVSPPVGLINAADLALGTVYSLGPFAAKRNAATAVAVIGVGGFLSYLEGALAWTGAVPGRVMVVAAVMALWMAVVGNTKDFDDARGDAQAGRRTLPVVVGLRAASTAVGVAVLLVGALAVAAATSGHGSAALVLLAPSAIVVACFCFGPLRFTGHAYSGFLISQLATNVALVALSATSVALR